MGQTRGVIYAIGTFFVLIYFGFIWFKPTKSKLNTWPPVINMCPDYLTYYKPTGGTGVCLDMLGVSKNGGLGTVVTNVAAATPTNTFIYTSNDVKNNTIYNQYKELADQEENVIFGGRLAEYKYYDMHQIIEHALNITKIL